MSACLVISMLFVDLIIVDADCFFYFLFPVVYVPILAMRMY
jgi:hypothetical protein